jgi:hypothetical protein
VILNKEKDKYHFIKALKTLTVHLNTINEKIIFIAIVLLTFSCKGREESVGKVTDTENQNEC